MHLAIASASLSEGNFIDVQRNGIGPVDRTAGSGAPGPDLRHGTVRTVVGTFLSRVF